MRLWHLLIAALQVSASHSLALPRRLAPPLPTPLAPPLTRPLALPSRRRAARAQTRSNLRAGSLQRARPRAGSAVVACAGGGDDDEPPPMEGFEKFVDVSLGTISWAFLPIILFTGILLSPDFAAGRPIRIGAQSRDPLASPVLERRAASGDAASTSVS